MKFKRHFLYSATRANWRILMALVLLPIGNAASQPMQDSLLHLYINEALQVSPRLRHLRAKEEAFAERLPQVSNLPDPRVAFSFSNLPVNTFSFTQEPMTGKTVGLLQEIPFPGKLSIREEIAHGDQLIAGEEYNDTQNEIARDVKQIYYEMAYLKEAIRVQEQSREVLRELSRTVRTKYEVGRGSQQDILKSDLEISRIADKLLKLRQLYNTALAQFDALLLKMPGTPVEVDTLRPPDQFALNDSLLLAIARQYRPLLKGVRSAVEKSQAQEALADRAWYPDFTLGVSYTQRDYLKATGVDFVDFASFSLSMNVPLNFGGKRSATAEEARSMERMFEFQYESVLQSLQKSFGKSIAALKSIQDRLDLLETGLIPQASQALNAALAGYQVGEVDYLTVLDTQVKLFQVEEDVYRLRADYWKEIAELEFLTGNEVHR